MADVCPLPAPGDPIVESLLGSTDCHVQAIVRMGYGSLFEGSGPLAAVLTTLLVVYVALIGYRLLLGRSQLNISDVALSAVKIGAVIALATQWSSYQTVVYRALFDGPQQVSDLLLRNVAASGAGYRGDVFEGLQRAFDDLTAAGAPASPASVPGATLTPAAQPSPSPGATPANGANRQGFETTLLMVSAAVLLLSSLGVLVAAKLVLGLLLAIGPVFIALFLFDSTRGLFAGWLRASLAFAFAPLSTLLVLGVGLSLLEPSLDALETVPGAAAAPSYPPGTAFGVLVIVMVLAGVSLGLVAAAGMIAGGFKLPGARAAAAAAPGSRSVSTRTNETSDLGRASRTAAAVIAQERRDARTLGGGAAGLTASITAGDVDRRTSSSTLAAPRSAPETVTVEARLGQAPRRAAQPRAARGAGARNA